MYIVPNTINKNYILLLIVSILSVLLLFMAERNNKFKKKINLERTIDMNIHVAM